MGTEDIPIEEMTPEQFNEFILNLESLEEELDQSENDINEESLNTSSNEVATATIDVIKNQKDKLADNYLDERKKEIWVKIIALVVFTGIIIYQLKTINDMMMGIGNGKLIYSDAVISIFITGVFAELFAIVKIMFTNLFPADNNKNQTDLIKSVILQLEKENEDKKDG